MSEFWTPGPWRVNPDDRPDMEWNNEIVHGSGEERICFMANFGGRADEGEANARLIAAAPELYEALQFIFERISDPERGPRELYPAFGLDALRAINKASAALAKARGGVTRVIEGETDA